MNSQIIALERDQQSKEERAAVNVKQALVRLVQHLHFFWERQRQRRRLLKMGDSTLKDIGINRVDARQEGRKQFWQN